MTSSWTGDAAVGKDRYRSLAGIGLGLVELGEGLDEIGKLGKPVGLAVKIRHDALDIAARGGDIDPAVCVLIALARGFEMAVNRGQIRFRFGFLRLFRGFGLFLLNGFRFFHVAEVVG